MPAMEPEDREPGPDADPASDRPPSSLFDAADLIAPSALPSSGARVLAFGAILLAGACGALIGFAIVDIQCGGDCSALSGIGAVVGGVVGALGVAVIAVLVLRAMAEWRRDLDPEDDPADKEPGPGTGGP